MKSINPVITVNDWNVYNESYGFYACNNGKTIVFTAEYRNGTYFKIKSYFNGKRAYTAQRYHYKLIPLVQEMTFALLQAGYLWDIKNDCPALETYKKDMLPYYNKCKETGMSIAPWIESLYI